MGQVQITYAISYSSDKQIGKPAAFCHMHLKSFSVVTQYRAFPVNLGFANQQKQNHVLTACRNILEEIAHLIYGRIAFVLKDFCQVSNL